MLHTALDLSKVAFRSSAEVRDKLRVACERHPDLAVFHSLGKSEEGRDIDAVILGRGPRTVCLLAGAHSDEPVGPETLRTLVLEGLRNREKLEPLWDTFRLIILPHINPDGEARNRDWIRRWPDAGAYLRKAFREPPGRDLEFGYPDMRIENHRVADFLKERAPFELHFSLHGMGFSEGAMLLIERHWIDRTVTLRERFVQYAAEAGLRLHDHDRGGEKGFQYIGPGFTTTPEGRAMQAHFRELGDEDTARRFRLSSMEYLRNLGGDPLCLVTELPLFVIAKAVPSPPGIPAAYLEFKQRLPELKLKRVRGESIAEELGEFQIRPLPLVEAVRFQLYVIELGLQTVGQEEG